jgi:hypothetical protein
MSSDYLSPLADLEDRFSTLAEDVRQGRRVAHYEQHRDDAWKKELVEVLEGVVGVVEDAQKTDCDNLEDVLERAEALLNPAIAIAYEGWDYQLFESLESFAHGGERPLAKLELGENVHRKSSLSYTRSSSSLTICKARQIVNAFKEMLRFMRKLDTVFQDLALTLSSRRIRTPRPN